MEVFNKDKSLNGKRVPGEDDQTCMDKFLTAAKGQVHLFLRDMALNVDDDSLPKLD